MSPYRKLKSEVDGIVYLKKKTKKKSQITKLQASTKRRPIYIKMVIAVDQDLLFRPLPHDGHLRYEEFAKQDFTYQLDLSINNYRQTLRVT